LLPGRDHLLVLPERGLPRAVEDLVRHALPADDSSMSLTCQLAPEPVKVTAYCALPLLAPRELTRCCVVLTTKVRLDVPNARSELIAAVPVEACFWPVRVLTTPGVE